MRKDLTLACKDEGTEIYRVLLTLSVKSTSRSKGKKEKRNGEKRTIMPTYFHLFFNKHVSIPNTPNILSNQSICSSSTICTNLSRCKEIVYPRYWKTKQDTLSRVWCPLMQICRIVAFLWILWCKKYMQNQRTSTILHCNPTQ